MNRIEVQGNQRVDAETIRAYLLDPAGPGISAFDEDESLKALFETGLFADVQIRRARRRTAGRRGREPGHQRGGLRGEQEVQGRSAWRRRPIAAARRVHARQGAGRRQRILELYRRSARFQASVTPETIDLRNNRVNLVFVITEGPKTGVSGITFIGNQAFGDARLRNVIDTRRSGILSFIRGGDIYDPDQLGVGRGEAAPLLPRPRLCRLPGHFLGRRSRSRAEHVFHLLHGQRRPALSLWRDRRRFQHSRASIRRCWSARSRPTRAMSSPRSEVEKSLEEITLYLAGNGYPFAQARPRLDRDPDTLTIGVTYVVDEGARVYVERIEVRGNTRTRDYVIRREFDIAEGDAFNRVLIDRAERRLKRLGYFSECAHIHRAGLVGGSRHRRRCRWSSSRPASSRSASAIRVLMALVGDVSLTEKNFLGRGYNLRVAVGGGTNSQTYEFGFTDPYFLGRRISAGINVFHRELRREQLPLLRLYRRPAAVSPSASRSPRISPSRPATRSSSRTSRSTLTSAISPTRMCRRTTSRAPSARPKARRWSRRSSIR